MWLLNIPHLIMIAEPYICIKGQRAGEIEWYPDNQEFLSTFYENEGRWQRYDDFEREKLRELGGGYIRIIQSDKQTTVWVVLYDGDSKQLKKRSISPRHIWRLRLYTNSL